MKYCDIEINENVYYDVKRIINEEYGIADTVSNATDDIIKCMFNRLRNGKNLQIIYKENNVKIITTDIQYTLGGHDINLVITIIDFPSEELKQTEDGKYVTDGGETDSTKNKITINGCSINMKIMNQRELYDTIQHELSHMYEDLNKADKHRDAFNEKDNKLYSNIVKTIFNDKYDQCNRSIAIGAYMCFQTEQTAFTNGLDAQLRNLNGMEKNYVIYKSEAWKMLQNLKLCIKYRELYIPFIEEVLHIPYEKYCKMTDKAYHDYARRIARVCYKYSVQNMLKEGKIPHFPFNVNKNRLI